MRKMGSGLSIVLLSVLIITGCGTTNSTSSNVNSNTTNASNNSSSNSTSANTNSSDSNAQIKSYLDSIKPIATQLQTISDAFNSTREQSKNGQITNDDFAQKLNDWVTQLNDINDKVLKLQESAPQSLQQPNMTLSTCIEDLSGSFLNFISGIQSGDSSKFATGNSQLSKSNQEQLDFINQIKSVQK